MPETVINIVPAMSGVTTALVLFIFAALLYPNVIKNRTQFYAGFACVLLILLLFSLDVMIRQPGFQVMTGAVTGLLQLFALIMFFMSAGGMSAGELAGEFKRSYEVIRRGEEEKTLIVPLTGEVPRKQAAPGDSAGAGGAVPSVREDIDVDLAAGGGGAGWPVKGSESKGSLPVDDDRTPGT
jgi:hypothetical protein